MTIDISNGSSARRRDCICEMRAVRAYRPVPGWLRFISVILIIAFTGTILPDHLFVPYAKASLPNGTKTTYTYDSLNRLKKLETRNASNVLLSRYEYTLHETGRRIGATEIILNEDDATYRTNVISWAYDGMYRLTNETRIVNGGTPTTDSYSYDLAGNRKQKSGTGVPPVAYSYNANDQLLSETTGTLTTSYLYDANGSLTNKTVTSGSRYAYTYDVQNRLASVSVDGGPATSFVYDYSGIRVRAGNRYFLVDPLNPTGYAQVLEEGTVSGSTFTLSRSYVLGDDVLAQVTGSTTQYLLYDGHGSTRQLMYTTPTGGTHVVEHYNYDAYGRTLGAQYTTQQPPATSLLYTGEQFDTNLQQYYLRARYYDPSNGRFNQMDTFAGNSFDPQSIHKYAYCAADPLNNLDPSGKDFTLVSLLVAGGIRGLLAGIVIGAVLREASYFIGNPVEQWSTTGALAAMGKGAATGAFGATVFGSAWFAAEGIYNGIEVWRDPKSTGLQKALGSVNILVGFASAYLLRGQVKSQWLEWQNIYSKVPLSTSVQTDFQAVKNAFNEGKGSITLGKTTIRFADAVDRYGGTLGDPNEFYLTKKAFEASDETLMKAIIEENVHNARIAAVTSMVVCLPRKELGDKKP